MVADDEAESHKKERAARKNKPALRFADFAFTPQDVLDFVELVPFTRRWEKLGLDDEDDLLALQLSIMVDPKGGPVIGGTSGLRKLRFAPPRWNIGKSGATRVLYVYFEEFGVVLLCLVYGKNEIGNISEAVKSLLNKHISETEQELQRRAKISGKP